MATVRSDIGVVSARVEKLRRSHMRPEVGLRIFLLSRFSAENIHGVKNVEYVFPFA